MYERPRLTVLGDVRALTLAASDPNGNDPCLFDRNRDVGKQTGPSDLIQGQAALSTCSA